MFFLGEERASFISDKHGPLFGGSPQRFPANKNDPKDNYVCLTNKGGLDRGTYFFTFRVC